MRIGFASRDWSFQTPEAHIVGMAGLPKLTGEDFQPAPTTQPVIGGAGYYRSLLPARALQLAGHSVYLGTLTERKTDGALGVLTFDGLGHFDCDVLVLQRWMHVDLAKAIRKARANGQVIVNDVDDWFDGLDPGNRAFYATHPKTNPDENRDHYRRILGAGDAVICSTPFLVEKMRRINDNVVLSRNRVDFDRYRSLWSNVWSKPAIGWVGALPWRSRGDIETLNGVLGPFVERENLRVIHGGATPWAEEPDGTPSKTFAERAGVDPDRVSERLIQPMASYPGLLTGMGIGVVPLRKNPFNEAKSFIKALEYTAAGIPWVATDTSEYVWLHENYDVGRIARKPTQWVGHWTALLDKDARNDEARKNYDAVRHDFGSEGLADQWGPILDAVKA